ncbi:hypothetical protein, partial [Enterobacter hormaechei]|uniref:hypothetical protein n=1 Tax=Enterobacter hormaechei TaxID=158836 RepID=UPI001F19E7FB
EVRRIVLVSCLKGATGRQGRAGAVQGEIKGFWKTEKLRLEAPVSFGYSLFGFRTIRMRYGC